MLAYSLTRLLACPLLAVYPCAAEDPRFFQNVTVEAGDTLWGLAQRYLTDPNRWPEILKHNKLPGSDPTVALPGLTLRIPVLMVKKELRAAKLTELANSVEHRRRDSPDWARSASGLELFQDDGLRTGVLSHARVRFALGEDLALGPRSFAVIRPDQLSDDLGRGVSLLSGEVRSRGTRVATQSARILPRDRNSEFRARVKENLATVVEVYEGAANVLAQGKSLTVPKGFASEVGLGLAPGPLVALPPSPKTVITRLAGELGSGSAAPVIPIDDSVNFDGSVLSFSAGRPRGVSAGPGIYSYRVQVAANTVDLAPVWERTLPIEENLDLRRIGLSDGSYYFRVSFQDRLGFEGVWSPWKKFTLDTLPPPLELDNIGSSNQILVTETPYLISGRSEPGAEIVAGVLFAASDSKGRFSLSMPLRPGENRVELRASDQGGNRTDRVVTLTYTPPGSILQAQSARRPDLPSGRIPAQGRGFGDSSERIARVTFATATLGIILTVVMFLLIKK